MKNICSDFVAAVPPHTRLCRRYRRSLRKRSEHGDLTRKKGKLRSSGIDAAEIQSGADTLIRHRCCAAAYAAFPSALRSPRTLRSHGATVISALRAWSGCVVGGNDFSARKRVSEKEASNHSSADETKTCPHQIEDGAEEAQPLFRRLSAAIVEMKSIERGERLPSRSWVIEADRKAGQTRKEACVSP